jgi:hypothetical protein
LIEKFANKVKDDVILKELSTILDDYNTEDVLKNFNWLEYKKQEYLFLLTLD